MYFNLSCTQASVEMVGRYTKEGRVFSLGIGEGSSRELVNGLARAGNGTALFVSDHFSHFNRTLQQI